MKKLMKLHREIKKERTSQRKKLRKYYERRQETNRQIQTHATETMDVKRIL